MTPSTFIGYFPKRRAMRSGWVSPHPDHPEAGFPAPAPVEEICSVSPCIAKGPEMTGEINQFGGYDSPAAAWRAVPSDQRVDFHLYAYRLIPMLFQDGQEEALDLPSLDLAPLSDAFECLGYDAVELTDGRCLGCSPLSCNGQTDQAALNRYCLVATEREGRALARGFSLTKPEPGPYAVVEVWRERDGGLSLSPNDLGHL